MDQYNEFNKIKFEKNKHEDRIFMFLKSPKLFTSVNPIAYSFKASFYHNVKEAHWQRSPTKQLKNLSKNKISLKI